MPEAELDRFLVKIRLTYPDRGAAEEEAILERHHRGFDARAIDDVVLEPLDLELLAEARREAQAVTVEAPLFTYIAAKNTAALSAIFDWYKDDFKAAGGTLVFINKRRTQPLPDGVKVTYQKYDWSLNEAK